jgi:exopolyphosphatase/guanosine-5'-triphosphate,3'-diphosphate pyrophosphatase
MPATRRDRLAVIDIGTNSIKLLVADVSESGVRPVVVRAATTRIGAGTERSGRIRQENLAASIGAIGEFAVVARRHGSQPPFAISTFALRRARNAREVIAAIERRTGVEVRVLTGREEARYSYLSARAHLARPRQFTLTFDIGGGSLEFVLARSGEILRSTSLPLGALALKERFLDRDPIDGAEYAALRSYATSRVARWYRNGPQVEPHRLDVVASGGTVTTLQRMALFSGTGGTRQVSRATLVDLEACCLAVTTSARRRIRGLPADRADIIPAGIAVVLVILDVARKRVLQVNPGGVREGVLMHRFQTRSARQSGARAGRQRGAARRR